MIILSNENYLAPKNLLEVAIVFLDANKIKASVVGGEFKEKRVYFVSINDETGRILEIINNNEVRVELESEVGMAIQEKVRNYYSESKK